MIVKKIKSYRFSSTHFLSAQIGTTPFLNDNFFTKTKPETKVVFPFQKDSFIGHLDTPITSSRLTKIFFNILPAYQAKLSPLLRGINIGFIHGYFLLGPFIKLGPLRDSQVANFVGFLATISLIIILTAGLLIYGYVTFPNLSTLQNTKKIKLEGVSKTGSTRILVDFLNALGWRQFSSGFIIGGFGGTSIAYVLIKLVSFNISSF